MKPFLLALVVGLSACSDLSFGEKTAHGEGWIEIHRPYYPFRHWKWSGIFPFEGGLIPDPHFVASLPMPLPKSIVKLVGEGKYQVFKINPWFESSEREVVVVTQLATGQISEWRLKDLGDPIIDQGHAPLVAPLAIESRIVWVSIETDGKAKYFFADPSAFKDDKVFSQSVTGGSDVASLLTHLDSDSMGLCEHPLEMFRNWYSENIKLCGYPSPNTDSTRHQP